MFRLVCHTCNAWCMFLTSVPSGFCFGLRFFTCSSMSGLTTFGISSTIKYIFLAEPQSYASKSNYIITYWYMGLFSRIVTRCYKDLVSPADTYSSVNTVLSETFGAYPTNCPTINPPLPAILVTFWPAQPPQFYIGPALIYRGREADSPTWIVIVSSQACLSRFWKKVSFIPNYPLTFSLEYGII